MTKINSKDLEKKIDDRLQKPFFTDMLILAAATGTDHFKYKKKGGFKKPPFFLLI